MEETGKIGRSCQGVLLLYASHLHAHVLRLDHDHHAQGIERLLDAILDLHGQPLLDLQAAGEDIHHPRDLAQAGNIMLRDIGHVRLAKEGQHMMLAQGKEIDILHDHHLLVILLLEHSGAQDRLRILAIPLRQELHRLSHTRRGFHQALAFRILAQKIEDILIMLGQHLTPAQNLVVNFSHLAVKYKELNRI